MDGLVEQNYVDEQSFIVNDEHDLVPNVIRMKLFVDNNIDAEDTEPNDRTKRALTTFGYKPTPIIEHKIDFEGSGNDDDDDDDLVTPTSADIKLERFCEFLYKTKCNINPIRK